MASMQEEGFYCIPELQLPTEKRTIYCGLCLASGLAGIIGSSWQTFQWKPFLRSYRDRRKPSPNPMIVVSLAIANILAGLGVLLRAKVMLVTDPPLPVGLINGTVGGLMYHPLNSNMPLIITSNFVEVLNQYFYGATFMWTLMYAFDIFLQLKNMDGPSAAYHAIAWIVPVLTTVGSLVAKSTFPGSPRTCAQGTHLVMRHLFAYSLILITMLGVPLLFVCCNKLMNKRMRESGLMNHHSWNILGALKTKFIAVIFLFTLCWFANIVDAIIQLVAVSTGASPASLAKYFPIWAIEALMNPIQGLLNCIVYGRHMFFWRIAQPEVHILQSEQKIREDMPILYTRNTTLLFASE